MPKEEIQRPGTAKPVANVILPTDTLDVDDDDNFMVEESKPTVAVEDDTVSGSQGSGITFVLEVNTIILYLMIHSIVTLLIE